MVYFETLLYLYKNFSMYFLPYLFVCLFIYLLINCSLFNDALSSSDYIDPNERMISE
jgi:hypothetical protein